MFGKIPRINHLESRKQLLIAESELNRALLVGDVAAFTAGARSFTARARSFGSLASSAAVLVAGLAAFKSRKSQDAAARPGWLQTAIKGAGLISTLWLAFRPPGRDSKTHSEGPDEPGSAPHLHSDEAAD